MGWLGFFEGNERSKFFTNLLYKCHSRIITVLPQLVCNRWSICLHTPTNWVMGTLVRQMPTSQSRADDRPGGKWNCHIRAWWFGTISLYFNKCFYVALCGVICPQIPDLPERKGAIQQCKENFNNPLKVNGITLPFLSLQTWQKFESGFFSPSHMVNGITISKLTDLAEIWVRVFSPLPYGSINLFFIVYVCTDLKLCVSVHIVHRDIR